eukprot:TRINITY_DN13669_c0_g1_i1.p1 TRINITY_DN13669_c0_g1~~TRINITY_DN13669_c0_g1_i1.p1  ORF type:complete len:459 (+),score=164.50 TRINITY_DN13669_c0_g1_i1:197-1378(+)
MSKSNLGKNNNNESIPRLGRPGNNLKIGIVGLPNVGKSTLFNVMSKLNIPAENYPFCTIEPNNSRVEVPDERFTFLCEHHKPASEVPAYLNITDIAGLVRGANEGEGLGNEFLSHIRAVDGIYQVLRIFDDEEIVHVDGDVDPLRDAETINNELRLKDIETVEKEIQRIIKVAKRDKNKKGDLEFLETLLQHLQDGNDVRGHPWTLNQVDVLNPLQLLSAKPIIYLINMSPKDFVRKKNKWLMKIKTWVEAHGNHPIIPFSATLETKLASMDEEEKEELMTAKKFKSSIPRIITSGYHVLNLIHFFTCGSDEVRCWTLLDGKKAPEAAGVIHTDMQKGFIKAEVMGYEDFVEAGSEMQCKNNGKYRLEGKNYVMKDGDIVFFKFNAAGGKKKK